MLHNIALFIKQTWTSKYKFYLYYDYNHVRVKLLPQLCHIDTGKGLWVILTGPLRGWVISKQGSQPVILIDSHEDRLFRFQVQTKKVFPVRGCNFLNHRKEYLEFYEINGWFLGRFFILDKLSVIGANKVCDLSFPLSFHKG